MIRAWASSRLTLWFSLVFASLGFAVLMLAVFAQATSGGAENYIKVISGVVTEALARLFFVQSNKARELMTDFFDKLRADRKLDESLRLAEETPGELMKSRIKVLLSLDYSQVQPDVSLLMTVLEPSGSKKAVASDERSVLLNGAVKDQVQAAAS